MIAIAVLAACAAVHASVPVPAAQRPVIAYHVQLDSVHTNVIHVRLHLEHLPDRVRLAMKVHPEYDARGWRYLAFDSPGLARSDTTLWCASLPGGRGDISYTVRVPVAPSGLRRAWMTTVRENGALLNPPDVLLYLPDFANTRVTVRLEIPRSWRVATSLPRARDGSETERTAASAAELLDAPIMLGALRTWRFTDRGNDFVVAYWPITKPVAFDTLAFVGELRALAHAAVAMFGSVPASPFYFLIQDGSGDALEHQASVTIGVPSADLARDPHTHLTEIAHEFFHTWNLVAIHPDSFGALSYRRAAPTTGLWWGEGVTMRYADVLPRRAGLVSDTASRATHLTDLLSRYLSAWWATRVAPEAASLAADASPLTNARATGGYYAQGELLGESLDAIIKDSTGNRRSLDDVMRALYSRRRGGQGFSSTDLEHDIDSVCACNVSHLFATQVHKAGQIDVTEALSRLGWRVVVDTVEAADDAGKKLPDPRLGAVQSDSALLLAVADSASGWWRAGLRTGDTLVEFNGTSPASFQQFYEARQGLTVSESISIRVVRGGTLREIRLSVPGYAIPHVRLVDMARVTTVQLENRRRWLAGW